MLQIVLLTEANQKKRFLTKFWQISKTNYDEINRCTRKIACDCIPNNCRSGTKPAAVTPPVLLGAVKPYYYMPPVWAASYVFYHHFTCFRFKSLYVIMVNSITEFNGSLYRQCRLCSGNCERNRDACEEIYHTQLFLDLYIIAAFKKCFYRSTEKAA